MALRASVWSSSGVRVKRSEAVLWGLGVGVVIVVVVWCGGFVGCGRV